VPELLARGVRCGVVRGSCGGFYRTWIGVRAGELQCAAHSCAAVRTSYATEPCPLIGLPCWAGLRLVWARSYWKLCAQRTRRSVGIIVGLGCERSGRTATSDRSSRARHASVAVMGIGVRSRKAEWPWHFRGIVLSSSRGLGRIEMLL
jgi:hypothetical protein